MFVFLALSTLYPNDRLSVFALAKKTCRAAKLHKKSTVLFGTNFNTGFSSNLMASGTHPTHD